jgi:DNA-binding transcriptional LysR family regulator
MNRLDLLQTFVDVVHAGNFSEAARRLHVPRSTVSLRIRMLEEASGTRLFRRSTRAVVLTDAGKHLYETVRSPMQALDVAWDSVRPPGAGLHGIVRITAPADFPTSRLADAIAGFRNIHPGVSIQLTMTNAVLDLLRDNIDLALRIGASNPKDAVMRRVLQVRWQFYAGRDWVKRHGVPDSIATIESFVSPAAPLRTYLENAVLGGQQLPPGAIEVDNHLLVRDLVARNVGVGLLPAALCGELERAGQIVPVLGEAITAEIPFSLTFTGRADISPQVRAFAEHFAGMFNRNHGPESLDANDDSSAW